MLTIPKTTYDKTVTKKKSEVLKIIENQHLKLK
ncbi:hypothetical protein ZONE111904_14025 [Zobellia nedashkovskayae]